MPRLFSRPVWFVTTAFLLAGIAVPALAQSVPKAKSVVIGTCTMPKGLRNIALPADTPLAVRLVQTGDRYDLVFDEGPFGSWQLSDGANVRQSGSPLNQLDLYADENRFTYRAGPDGMATLDWHGEAGKHETTDCLVDHAPMPQTTTPTPY